MPFGLKNAPQIFQRMMDRIFSKYSFILVYDRAWKMGLQAHLLNPKGKACPLKHSGLLMQTQDEGPVRWARLLKHSDRFDTSLGCRVKAQSARPKGRLWVIKKANILQIKSH